MSAAAIHTARMLRSRRTRAVQNSRLSSSSMRRKSPRSRTLRMIMHDRCTLIAYIYQVDRHIVQGRQRGGPMGNHRRIYLIHTPKYGFYTWFAERSFYQYLAMEFTSGSGDTR